MERGEGLVTVVVSEEGGVGEWCQEMRERVVGQQGRGEWMTFVAGNVGKSYGAG